jgi:hypothetical protein
MNRVVLFLICLLSLQGVVAQTVYEPLYKSVYPFLERTAQRGVIDLNDVVLPLSRKDITNYLHTLQQKRSDLTALEKKELDYYLKEYTYETNLLFADSLLQEEAGLSFFTLRANDRPRLIASQSKKFTANVQPILGYDFISNSEGGSNGTMRAGFWTQGYIGKNVGFSLDYRTSITKGDGIDYERQFTPEPGVIGQRKRNGDFVYTDLKASLSYSWDWGALSIGKDIMPIGYGNNGRIILSDKSPSYPLIRLDVKPLKWLAFNYAHMWLNSEVVDSSRIRYSGYGNKYQINDVPKKMATHSVIITPFKGLSWTVGESIIYNDEVKLIYLTPVSFFRSASLQGGEAESTTLSNSQFFTQLSSRGHIPHTHLYLSWFIDELRVEDSRRNQSSFNAGFSVTDFPLPNLTFGASYTKVRPYTYVHHMNTLDYRHAGYALGHWIGTNADQIAVDARYRILRGLQLYASYIKVRKGEEGNPGDQVSEVGTPFLWGDVTKYGRSLIQAEYEMTADLFFKLQYRQEKTGEVNNNSFSIGLTYGY